MLTRALYKGLLRGPAFRGRHRLEAFLRKRLLPATDIVDGLRMELDPQEWLQISMLAGQSLEPQTIALYRRVLAPGDAFIDVGAHVGLHALIAIRCVGSSGQVVAVDPQPYNCEKMIVNAAENGFSNLTVVCAAAGSADTTVLLRGQSRSDKARLTLAGEGVNDVGVPFEAPVVRLDTLAARRGVEKVRILKIDAEGYEREILIGAGDLLDRIDNVVFECLPETPAHEVEGATGILEARGFSFWQVDGSPWSMGEPLIEHNIWARRTG